MTIKNVLCLSASLIMNAGVLLYAPEVFASRAAQLKQQGLKMNYGLDLSLEEVQQAASIALAQGRTLVEVSQGINRLKTTLGVANLSNAQINAAIHLNSINPNFTLEEAQVTEKLQREKNIAAPTKEQIEGELMPDWLKGISPNPSNDEIAAARVIKNFAPEYREGMNAARLALALKLKNFDMHNFTQPQMQVADKIMASFRNEGLAITLASLTKDHIAAVQQLCKEQPVLLEDITQDQFDLSLKLINLRMDEFTSEQYQAAEKIRDLAGGLNGVTPQKIEAVDALRKANVALGDVTLDKIAVALKLTDLNADINVDNLAIAELIVNSFRMGGNPIAVADLNQKQIEAVKQINAHRINLNAITQDHFEAALLLLDHKVDDFNPGQMAGVQRLKNVHGVINVTSDELKAVLRLIAFGPDFTLEEVKVTRELQKNNIPQPTREQIDAKLTPAWLKRLKPVHTEEEKEVALAINKFSRAYVAGMTAPRLAIGVRLKNLDINFTEIQMNLAEKVANFKGGVHLIDLEGMKAAEKALKATNNINLVSKNLFELASKLMFLGMEDFTPEQFERAQNVTQYKANGNPITIENLNKAHIEAIEYLNNARVQQATQARFELALKLRELKIDLTPQQFRVAETLTNKAGGNPILPLAQLTEEQIKDAERLIDIKVGQISKNRLNLALKLRELELKKFDQKQFLAAETIIANNIQAGGRLITLANLAKEHVEAAEDLSNINIGQINQNRFNLALKLRELELKKFDQKQFLAAETIIANNIQAGGHPITLANLAKNHVKAAERLIEFKVDPVDQNSFDLISKLISIADDVNATQFQVLKIFFTSGHISLDNLTQNHLLAAQKLVDDGKEIVGITPIEFKVAVKLFELKINNFDSDDFEAAKRLCRLSNCDAITKQNIIIVKELVANGRRYDAITLNDISLPAQLRKMGIPLLNVQQLEAASKIFVYCAGDLNRITLEKINLVTNLGKIRGDLNKVTHADMECAFLKANVKTLILNDARLANEDQVYKRFNNNPQDIDKLLDYIYSFNFKLSQNDIINFIKIVHQETLDAPSIDDQILFTTKIFKTAEKLYSNNADGLKKYLTTQGEWEAVIELHFLIKDTMEKYYHMDISDDSQLDGFITSLKDEVFEKGISAAEGRSYERAVKFLAFNDDFKDDQDTLKEQFFKKKQDMLDKIQAGERVSAQLKNLEQYSDPHAELKELHRATSYYIERDNNIFIDLQQDAVNVYEAIDDIYKSKAQDLIRLNHKKVTYENYAFNLLDYEYPDATVDDIEAIETEILNFIGDMQPNNVRKIGQLQSPQERLIEEVSIFFERIKKTKLTQDKWKERIIALWSIAPKKVNSNIKRPEEIGFNQNEWDKALKDEKIMMAFSILGLIDCNTGVNDKLSALEDDNAYYLETKTAKIKILTPIARIIQKEIKSRIKETGENPGAGAAEERTTTPCVLKQRLRLPLGLLGNFEDIEGADLGNPNAPQNAPVQIVKNIFLPNQPDREYGYYNNFNQYVRIRKPIKGEPLTVKKLVNKIYDEFDDMTKVAIEFRKTNNLPSKLIKADYINQFKEANLDFIDDELAAINNFDNEEAIFCFKLPPIPKPTKDLKMPPIPEERKDLKNIYKRTLAFAMLEKLGYVEFKDEATRKALYKWDEVHDVPGKVQMNGRAYSLDELIDLF